MSNINDELLEQISKLERKVEKLEERNKQLERIHLQSGRYYLLLSYDGNKKENELLSDDDKKVNIYRKISKIVNHFGFRKCTDCNCEVDNYWIGKVSSENIPDGHILQTILTYFERQFSERLSDFLDELFLTIIKDNGSIDQIVQTITVRGNGREWNIARLPDIINLPEEVYYPLPDISFTDELTNPPLNEIYPLTPPD